MIIRKTLHAVAFIAVTAVAVGTHPTPASTCVDLGHCRAPEVFEPAIEISPNLACLDIRLDMVTAHELEHQWTLRAENQCDSAISASVPLFECRERLEPGESRNLTVYGNARSEPSSPSECPARHTDVPPTDTGPDVGDVALDAGGPADTGDAGDAGGPEDAGSPADRGVPPIDAGSRALPPGEYERNFTLAVDGSEHTLTYRFVVPTFEQKQSWEETNCPGPCRRDTWHHPPSPEPDTVDRRPDAGDRPYDTNIAPQNESSEDENGFWKSSGGGEDGCGCSATPDHPPLTALLLLVLAPLVRRAARPVPSA